MPRIVSLRRGSIATADPGYVTCQLRGGASAAVIDGDIVPAFSLLYRYPPMTTELFRVNGDHRIVPPQEVSLVQVPISLAESVEELARIASVSFSAGDAERDKPRVVEAFNMFRNRSREIASARIDACVRDAFEVVKCYYDLCAWMRSGMGEKKELQVATSYMQREGETLETTLVLMP